MRGQTAKPSSNPVERQEARRRFANAEGFNAAAASNVTDRAMVPQLHPSAVIHRRRKKIRLTTRVSRNELKTVAAALRGSW